MVLMYVARRIFWAYLGYGRTIFTTNKWKVLQFATVSDVPFRILFSLHLNTAQSMASSLSIGTRIFGPFSYTREARPKRATSNHPNAKARRVLRSKNPRHLPQHASGPFPVVSTENESCLRRSSGFASPFPRGFLPVKIHMFLTFSLLR